MDLEFLKNLLLIEEEKSITRAASRLFISQSALNQQLTRLEADLDTRLFIRNRGHWQPTETGRVYLDGAREILSLYETTIKRIEVMKEKRQKEISIGLIPERGIAMFTEIYPVFHKLYPDITLEPRELSVREILPLIRKGELHLGLVTLTKEQMDDNTYHVMCAEEIYLAVPNGHPFGQRGSHDPKQAPSIKLSAFSDSTFILIYKSSTMYALIEEAFRQAGFHPQVLFTTSSTYSMKSMIRLGLGCALIPGAYVDYDEEISWFHLDPPPTWLVTMCTGKGLPLTKAEMTLLKLCKDYWQKK